MKRERRVLHGLRPWLSRLECRTTPAGAVSLVSTAAPNLISDTAGGRNSIEGDLAPWKTISSDGRFSVFTSTATNLVAGQNDVNGDSDVFLFDRQLNQLALVSHATSSPTLAANGRSMRPKISSDGRYITFESIAGDLVGGFVDNNEGGDDLYVFDRLSSTVSLVSHSSSSATAGGNSTGPLNVEVVSANGIVAYSSPATNLVAGYMSSGVGNINQVYMHDIAAGSTTLVSRAFGSANTGGNYSATPYDISSDGRYLVFISRARNLFETTTTWLADNVFLYDRMTGHTTLVSESASASEFGGDLASWFAAISSDGNWIAFASDASNLIAGNSVPLDTTQIYLYSRLSGAATLLSHDATLTTAGANNISFAPTISADGRFVAYNSTATNVVSGFVDANGAPASDAYLFDRDSATNTLITHSWNSPIVGGNGASSVTSMSSDGHYLAITSVAQNLVSGFVDSNGSNNTDVFLLDAAMARITLVSHSASASGMSGNDVSRSPFISGDGASLFFASDATDLIAGAADLNQNQDVFLYHRAADNVALVSRRAPSMPSQSGGGDSQSINGSPFGNIVTGGKQLSDDGRYAVFSSLATNLLGGQNDDNLAQDVFFYDRQLDALVLVSRAVGTTATAGNAASSFPTISTDGRYVVFASAATDIVPGFVDRNGPTGNDVFLWDRLGGSTVLVSRQNGSTMNGGNLISGAFNFSNAYQFAISGDGRYVAYTSYATDLVAGFVDRNGANSTDLFLFDRESGTNQLVSRASGTINQGGNDFIWQFPSISANGRYVAFAAHATNLVAGKYIAGRNVFLFDRDTGTNVIVSHADGSSTTTGNGGSDFPAISADGRYVVYDSASNTIVSGADPNDRNDVFLYDRLTGVNTLVSHALGLPNQAGSRSSDWPAINADGRYIVYLSRATDLVAGFVDNNGFDDFSDTSGSDVFVYDRMTGQNVLISGAGASLFVGSNGQNYSPVISGSGRFAVFSSAASNLIAGYVDLSPAVDLIVFDRLSHSLTLVSHSTAGLNIGGNGYTTSPSINFGGSIIGFDSRSDNLVPGDYNGWSDVFWYSNAPAVQSVTIANGSAQRSVVRSVTIAFDQFVPFVADPSLAFEVKRVGAATGLQLAVSVSNSPNTTVTLTFGGPGTEFGSLIDGKYTLTVRSGLWAGGITNLDGNNDGFAGDDYTFTFHRLFGDADGNGTVNTVDFNALRIAFGSSSFIFDFNNTGSVDTADFNQFRARFGSSV